MDNCSKLNLGYLREKVGCKWDKQWSISYKVNQLLWFSSLGREEMRDFSYVYPEVGEGQGKGEKGVNVVCHNAVISANFYFPMKM